ncbi:hypothetical protein [Allomuricauda sp. CP2A]|jgi:hypothetical protein|uniref:hypothetical protein n=1 Tax=Allomuricauda sp. CP2A TaxID=1848189 RepID=UPI00159EF479|nr:hypothetical protein [Muricauda sp. CP2A]
MNVSALILMVVTVGTVAGVTIYLFVKVLRTPPNPEPDSYNANDDVEERQGL